MRDGGPFVLHAELSNLRKKWERIIVLAEIPAITRHDLRRTAITRALLAGVAPPVVQRLAGHKDIKTTMDHYFEVEKEELRRGRLIAKVG